MFVFHFVIIIYNKIGNVCELDIIYGMQEAYMVF